MGRKRKVQRSEEIEKNRKEKNKDAKQRENESQRRRLAKGKGRKGERNAQTVNERNEGKETNYEIKLNSES